MTAQGWVALLALALACLRGAAAQGVVSEDGFAFTADQVSGSLEDETTRTSDSEPVGFDAVPTNELQPVAEAATAGTIITRQNFSKKGNLVHLCGCSASASDPIDPNMMRAKSDKWLKGGTRFNLDRWSNMLWAWGQFIDHDIVATVEDAEPGAPAFTANIKKGRRKATMTLHRLAVDAGGECRSPIVVNSPQIDASQIYASDEAYLQTVLREPDSCKLRTSRGNLLPVTTAPDANGQHRFVAGDARVNEHAVLTGMHTLWVREHNRLCDHMDADAAFAGLSVDAKFERARQVVTAKTQQITLYEWLPMLGISPAEVRGWSPKIDTADVSIEWFIMFRFGHDIIGDRIGRFKVKNIFNAEKFFRISSANGSRNPRRANSKFELLFLQARSAPCADLDGLFADSLRNFLFGPFGEDLATRNMFRSNEVGMQPYSELASCFGVTPSSEILDLVAQTSSDIPALALMKENAEGGPGEKFGAVGKAILTDQFHRLLFGSQGLWWEHDPSKVDGFAAEIEATTLGSVLDANMEASYSGNVFSA